MSFRRGIKKKRGRHFYPSKEKLIITLSRRLSERLYFVHRILAFVVIKIATRFGGGRKKSFGFVTERGEGNRSSRQRQRLGRVIYPANSLVIRLSRGNEKSRRKERSSRVSSVEKSILAGAQWKKNFQLEEK